MSLNSEMGHLPGASAVPAISLLDETSFRAHPWIQRLERQYDQDALLAKHGALRLAEDLEALNAGFVSHVGRVQFTTIQRRVKSADSFFRKLLSLAREKSSLVGITPDTLAVLYESITDLCGVRFACPYYDDVIPAIREVRLFLGAKGYATDLSGRLGCGDRDYLDSGDARGYRSYHFFVRVPTTVDIYGNVALCVAEVQARSELQHVWADKSHDLLYKPSNGWRATDDLLLEDMRQVSNSLRVADQFLISVRDRSRRGGGGND